MDALALGLSLGLGAGLAPGPLFVLVVRATLEQGLAAGLRTACAPLLSDAPIIALSVLVLTGLPEEALAALSLAGAAFCARLAWESLHPDGAPPAELRRAVVVNALSPHPWVFWATVGGPLAVDAAERSTATAIAFGAAFYATLIGAKAALALVVHAGRRRVSPTSPWVRYGSAALLGAAALALLADALERLLG